MTEPESIVRTIDGWKLEARQLADGQWRVDADDITWAEHDDETKPDLEDALVRIAPRLRLDSYEVRKSFGLL